MNDSQVRIVATYSNLNRGSSYGLKSFDITPYKGQTLQVYFLGTENYARQTSFLIDDTALDLR